MDLLFLKDATVFACSCLELSTSCSAISLSVVMRASLWNTLVFQWPTGVASLEPVVFSSEFLSYSVCVCHWTVCSEIFFLHDNPLSDHFLLSLSPSVAHWFLVCMPICFVWGRIGSEVSSDLVVQEPLLLSLSEIWCLTVAKAFRLG